MARHADEYKITAFKQIGEDKKDLETVDSLNLTLNKIPKIFDFMGKFPALNHLNLSILASIQAKIKSAGLKTCPLSGHSPTFRSPTIILSPLKDLKS